MICEKSQGKFVKMLLGVARNTLDYIWKLEAGKRSVEIETRRRAAKYIVEILKMKEDRWPKVCLREEIRRIINRNPSQWRREFKQALEEVGDGRIVDAIWKESEWREVLILLGEGLTWNEKKNRTHKAIGWSSQCIILQILWGNKENRGAREGLEREGDQRRNERKMGKIEMW